MTEKEPVFLRVKRAQADEPSPDLLELRVLRDDRYEIGRFPDPRDVFVNNPHAIFKATAREVAPVGNKQLRPSAWFIDAVHR